MRSIRCAAAALLLCLLLSGCGGAPARPTEGPAAGPAALPGDPLPVETETLSAPAASLSGPGVAPVEVPRPDAAGSDQDPETVPAETLPPARVFTDEDFHFYDGRTGERMAGKINVAFYPDQNGPDGTPDPDIRVWDSCEITHPEEIRAICQRILDSSFYDQDVYGRTLDSMVTEWEAHNSVHMVYPNERTRHVDFNRADEGLSYLDFWQRAAQTYLDSVRN